MYKFVYFECWVRQPLRNLIRADATALYIHTYTYIKRYRDI